MRAGVGASHSEDTSEDPLSYTTHLIKTTSWKLINNLENKRKTGGSQADLFQSPTKVYMTCVQRGFTLNPVAANSFISQDKWDFCQCRKIYSLSCMKWKNCTLKKNPQRSNHQKQPDVFMNITVIFIFFLSWGKCCYNIQVNVLFVSFEGSSDDSTLKSNLFSRIML